MIIDYIDNLTISEEKMSFYANQFGVLHTLKTGLDYLNLQVSKIEDEARRRLDAENKVVFSFGNDPRLEELPLKLIGCCFRWYSVTVCDYVRLIGWVAFGGDVERARRYQHEVVPEISRWRNKVGAHAAITDPRRDDTPADLLASSIPYDVTFYDHSFATTAGHLIASPGSEEGGSSSRQDMAWCLTATHRQLAERYGWATTP